MKRTRKANGKCVYTTAKEITKEEFIRLRPDYKLNGEASISRFCIQAGNGSVRCITPGPRKGKWTPFVLPAPYKPHKSYPLDERGVDPRDVAEVEANRRYYGL